MPGSVFKWGIQVRPVAGIINKNHKSNRGATEYIEGIKAFLHLRVFKVQDSRYKTPLLKTVIIKRIIYLAAFANQTGVWFDLIHFSIIDKGL
jgi:hypothetical protein